MALKTVKAAQIINEFEDKIKAKALPENISMDVLKQSLDFVKKVLGQSQGENLDFKNYQQFHQYIFAIGQLENISRGMTVEQAAEVGFIPYKGLTDLLDSWRKKKRVVYVPKPYAERAIKNYRLFNISFDPVRDYTADMDKFTAVIEDLKHKIAERNKDKGEEIKNLIIDPRELSPLQRQALGQVNQYLRLYDDPKYQFSVQDLQGLFRAAMAPRPPDPRKKLEEEIALERKKLEESQAKKAADLAAAQAQKPTLTGTPIPIPERPDLGGPRGQVVIPGQAGLVQGLPVQAGLPGAPVTAATIPPGTPAPETAPGSEPGMVVKHSAGVSLLDPEVIQMVAGIGPSALDNLDIHSAIVNGALNNINEALAVTPRSIFSSGWTGGWERAFNQEIEQGNTSKLLEKFKVVEQHDEELHKLQEQIAELEIDMIQENAKNKNIKELMDQQVNLVAEFTEKNKKFEETYQEKWHPGFDINELKELVTAAFKQKNNIAAEAELEALAKQVAAPEQAVSATGVNLPPAAAQAALGREKDYYKIFSLVPGATLAEINKRYQELMDQYKYAAVSGNSVLMQEIQDIHDAYQALTSAQAPAVQPGAPQPLPTSAAAVSPKKGLTEIRQKRVNLLKQIYLGQKSKFALFTMARLEDEDSITRALGIATKDFKGKLKKRIKDLFIKGAVGLGSFTLRKSQKLAKKLDITLRKELKIYRKISIKVRLGKAAAKKAKQQNRLLRFLVNAFFKNTIGKITKLIKNATKTVGRVTGVTRAVANMKTAQYLGQKAAQYIPAVRHGAQLVKGGVGKVFSYIHGAGIKVNAGYQFVKTTGGRIITFVHNTGKVLNHLGSGIPKGALAGLAGFVITGNLPGAAIAFTAGTAINSLNSTLASRDLTGPKWLTGFKERFGWGQFQDKYGWKLDANQDPKLAAKLATIENIFGNKATSFSRIIRALGSAGTFGSIGALIGGLAGAPLAGAALGIGVGFAGRQIVDRINGVRVAKGLKFGLPQNIFQRLAAIPTFTVINRLQGTAWMFDQINKIRHDYKGDVGKYLSENMTGIMGVVNGLGAMNYITGTFATARIILRSLGVISSTVGNLRKALAANLNPITISSVAGMTIGPLIAAALGIPLGAGAIVGATAGGILGTVVGVAIGKSVGAILAGAITALSSGTLTTLAIAVSTLISTAVTSFIGTIAGSFVDKAIGRVTNSLIGFIYGLQALFNLISSFNEGFNLGNIVPLALGLVGLLSTLNRMSQSASANDCTQPGACPSGSGTSQDNFNKYDLDNYGVSLINSPQIILSNADIQNIIFVLDKFSEDYDLRAVDKKIVLVVGVEHNYSDEKLTILSISENILKDKAALYSSLFPQLQYLVLDSTVNPVGLAE